MLSTTTPATMKTPVKTIHVTREMIESTTAFQQTTKMIQQLTLNRTNFKWIQHGVNVSLNIGFKQWNNQTSASFTNTMIIKELVTKHLENENQ